jgi:hypothetical protein
MFTDINMGVMLKIVFAVLKDAIGPFFSALPQKSNEAAPAPLSKR